MLLTIDTSTLSETDKAVLRALLADESWPPPKAEPKAAPTPEKEPEAVETPVEAEPDISRAEPTLDQAVQLATQLVSGGKAAAVKEALAGVGAKRVSELKGKPDSIAAFIGALS